MTKTNAHILGKLMVLLLVLFFLPAAVMATVIDFEDVAPGNLADGYKSLHWSNVAIEQSPGLLSGNVAYGNKISIYTGPFGYFNLVSMDIASETANTVWIEAKRFSGKVFLKEVNIDELKEALLNLNLTGITTLNMWSGDNSTFLMDNIKVTWLCSSCADCGNLNSSIGSTGSTTMVYTQKKNLPPGSVVPPAYPPPEPPFPEPPPPAPVPEPSTLILVGSGLIFIAGFRKRVIDNLA